MVVRELEDWEAEFVEFSEARQEALAREYPAELCVAQPRECVLLASC